MAREDFVTEPPAMSMDVKLDLWEWEPEWEWDWKRPELCHGCHCLFHPEVLCFHWEGQRLCWNCAPDELQAFARMAYLFAEDGTTTQRWMPFERGRDHLRPDLIETLTRHESVRW